ncbi:MAG: hypothetical protein HY925_08955 [Elusimicrobia bacterium]|nr:hypothetical protein [Elusimicrobiota bacterium]
MASSGTRPEAIFLLALAIVPPVAWLGLKPPSGRPVPANAVLDKDSGIAVAPPAGWNVERSMATTGDRTDLFTLSKEQGLINVSVTPLDMPRDEGSTLKIREFIKVAFGGRIDSYGIDEPRLDQVDNLKAIKLKGRGAKDKQQLGFLCWIVKGPGRTILLLAYAEDGPFAQLDEDMRQAMLSTYVVDRPWGSKHLWELAFGKLRQEMIGALLGAIFAIYRLIFSSVTE